MSSPAPGIQRLPVSVGDPSLEYTRTVAELGSLSMALNQSGYGFELVDVRPSLADVASETHACHGRVTTVELLPMDSSGDTSLRLIAFAMSHRMIADSHTVPLDGDDAGSAPAVIAAAATAVTLASRLPIGSLTLDERSTLHLDYTLAVDALGAMPADTVVDVMHLLDELFTAAFGQLQAAAVSVAPIEPNSGEVVTMPTEAV